MLKLFGRDDNDDDNDSDRDAKKKKKTLEILLLCWIAERLKDCKML